jgi:hypothetical protein
MKRADDLKAVFGTAARAFMLALAASAMLILAACGSSPESSPKAEEDAIAQQELDALNQELARIDDQLDQLPDGEYKERRLREFKEKTILYQWPRHATEIKREVQSLKDWVTEAQKMAAAEAAKQAEATKQAEEQRLAANARGVTEEDFTVDVTRDGKGLIITGYKGAATEVKIPASIQGFPVREIGARAFSGSTITSVVIPEGVTSIDSDWSDPNGAFSGCGKLAQVTLPSTLEYIGDRAFTGTALKAVVIPRGVKTIGRSAFNGCTSLASVTIPNSVREIDVSAFSGCTSLASITIPDSVKEIGYKVFSGCTSLASVTIPNSVTAIGDEAFENCTSLTTVTISPVERRFGYMSFRNCPLSLASQAALRAAGYEGRFDEEVDWGH